MTTPTEGLEIAREVLDSEPWLPTPMLPASTLGGRLGLDLWLKREDCSPIGSFKLRGMLVTVARRAAGVGPAGVYAASAGNYGLAVAEACRRSGIRATIMLPEVATPSKVERIKLCGAEVVQYGRDFDAAKDYARSTAEQEGADFWEDGVVEEMSFGSSTIAAEIIESGPPFDYVLVPLGNGSLLRGIASLFKELSPQTAVVGLVSTASPAMGQAMLGEAWDAHTFVDCRRGRPCRPGTDTVDRRGTQAPGRPRMVRSGRAAAARGSLPDRDGAGDGRALRRHNRRRPGGAPRPDCRQESGRSPHRRPHPPRPNPRRHVRPTPPHMSNDLYCEENP